MEKLDLKIGEEKERKFVVDKKMFEITLRRFYFAHISKFNLEEWYNQMEAFTTKSKWFALS